MKKTIEHQIGELYLSKVNYSLSDFKRGGFEVDNKFVEKDNAITAQNIQDFLSSKRGHFLFAILGLLRTSLLLITDESDKNYGHPTLYRLHDRGLCKEVYISTDNDYSSYDYDGYMCYPIDTNYLYRVMRSPHIKKEWDGDSLVSWLDSRAEVLLAQNCR